jgi:hypothetical protein
MGLFLPEVAHVRGELVIHRVGAGGQAFAYPGDVLCRTVLAEFARALQAGDGQADADDGAEHAVEVVGRGIGHAPRRCAPVHGGRSGG